MIINNHINKIDGDFYFFFNDENTIAESLVLGNKNISISNLYHCINHMIYNCATNERVDNIKGYFDSSIYYVYKSIKINEYKEDTIVYLNLSPYYIDGSYINGILGVLKDDMIYTEYFPPVSSVLVNYFSFECVDVDEQIKINCMKKRIYNKIDKIDSFKNCVEVNKRYLFSNDYVLYYNGVLSLGCLTPLGEVITPYGYANDGTQRNTYYKIDFDFNLNNNIIWYSGIYEKYFNKKMIDVLGNQLCVGDFVIIDFNSKNITYGLVISSTQCLVLSGKRVKCSSVCKIASLNNISNLSSDELVIYNKLKEMYNNYINLSIQKINNDSKQLGQVYYSNRGTKYYIYLGKYLCQFKVKTNYFKYINDYENKIVDLYLIIDLNKQYQVNFYNSLLNNCAVEEDFMDFCGLINEKSVSVDTRKICLGHFDANIGKGKMSKELTVVNIPSFMKQINITSARCDAMYIYQGI